MSPELLHPERFGFKESRPTKESDYYALGMVIFEVLSGQVPFANDKEYIVTRKVTDGERPERPAVVWFTDDLWRTLDKCWLPQPGDRPTVETVLECLRPLSATWQPLPPSTNEDTGRDFNDSRSTLGYCCMFLRLVSDLTLKPSCSGLNTPPGYQFFASAIQKLPSWYAKLGTFVIVLETRQCKTKCEYVRTRDMSERAATRMDC